MNKIITKLEPMTIEILMEAFYYALNNKLTFSHFKNISKSHVQIQSFKIDSKNLNVSIMENNISKIYKPEKITLRIHPDFKKHNGIITKDQDNDDLKLNFSSEINEDFLELNSHISKQQRKYISTVVKNFKNGPTAQKASNILKLFPIEFDNVHLLSVEPFKEYFTLKLCSVSAQNTDLLIKEISDLSQKLDETEQELTKLLQNESILKEKIANLLSNKSKISMLLSLRKSLL